MAPGISLAMIVSPSRSPRPNLGPGSTRPGGADSWSDLAHVANGHDIVIRLLLSTSHALAALVHKLRSMALTSRDAAISILIAFIAWGFLTHWLPVVRLVGYAFVAGALLSTIGFGLLIVLSSRNRKSPSLVADYGQQTAAFVAPVAWKEETQWLDRNKTYVPASIFTSSTVSQSFNELLGWVLRDFVTSWYTNISKTPRFANEIDRTVRGVLASVLRRLESQDFVEAAVLRFVPLITNHLREFYEAEQVVRGKNLNRNMTESEELDLAIAAKYGNGRLHPAASLSFSDTKMAQQEYLRKIVSRLMPELLPYDMMQSKAVVVLVTEIVSCAVLEPIMQILSEPDTWNQVMEAYGRTMLQDRKTVRKLRAALDEHASPAPKKPRTHTFPKLNPHDDERKFERFVRAIRQCNNLSDARRFRSEVASQLKRESMLEGQDHIYLKRLGTGKRILDQKVGMLSAVGGAGTQSGNGTSDGNSSSRMANATLQEVLHDASGLSYFMEYMDRQNLMTLVQFWIVVDGFRNPLEDDLLDEVHAEDSSSKWTESDRLDIAQISEAYLSKPELNISTNAREGVREFLKAGKHATVSQYWRARGAILKAQSTALEEMQEKYFPNFRRSDLFYKLLTSDDASQKPAPKSTQKTLRPPQVVSLAEAIHTSAPSSRPMSRVNSSTASKLSRTVASTADLKSVHRLSEDSGLSASRRSLDVNTSGPLFDDDIDSEALARSSHSIDVESANGDQAGSQEQMVEAMEAALNTIMTSPGQEDDSREPLFDDHDQDTLFGKTSEASHTHPDLEKSDLTASEKRVKPNLASLGLVNTSGRIGVFRDNDLFGDEDKFLEDEHPDSELAPDSPSVEDEIHEAAPGDLGLAEAISALTVDIDKMVAQESIVDALTRKAELTNNVAELRILGKSKSSLQREIRRKELQRQQYIVQESDNSLFGRASIEIKSIMTGKDEEGQEFALYVIEVQRKAGDHMPAAIWAVARRFSEFHDLHQRLKQIYPAVRQLEFPRRRIVMKLQRETLHKRRIALENYLRELLRLPAVCRSRDLRSFLSQRPILAESDINNDGKRADIVSRLYNSVADGMDDFLGNIPVLDQLSLAGQNLISAATSQYYNTAAPPTIESGDTVSGAAVEEAQAELEAFDSQTIEPFVKPICDLFLEMFELNRSQNWLRGRAVVVVLHQLLGGTVERKVRETAKTLTSDTNLIKYITMAKETMWPNGILQKDRVPRTESQKKATRKEASVTLATLVPELAGGIVGRANAQAAGRRVFATVNNRRLNAHMAFKLLDEFVGILFPESVEGRRGGIGSSRG